MAYVGNPIDTQNTFQSLVGKRFSGDGSETEFTLDVAPSSTLDIEVFVGNVRQDPNSAYTLSGTTLTFTGAPPSGTNNIYVVHQAKSVGTINPGANSVGVTELNLSDGSNGQAITTNGSGTLSFSDVSSTADGFFATSGLSSKDLGNGLHIKTGDSGQSSVEAEADLLVLESSGGGGLSIYTGNSHEAKINFGDNGNDNQGQIIYHHNGDSMRFNTDNNERMRIDSVGKVGIGETSPASKLHLKNTTNDINLVKLINAHGQNGQYGLQISFDVARDNNSQHSIVFDDASAVRFKVWSDGDVVNHDNSYGSTSDERIKQDIRDSNSQWNDIKAVKVRNFKKKDDVRQYGENAWEQIGVVAQELETVSPKLIKNSDPTPSDILSDSSFGTLYQEGDEIPEGKNIGDVKEIKEQVKKVSYSVLYMKSIKALQEAMNRIETLETEMTALKARVTTLEG